MREEVKESQKSTKESKSWKLKDQRSGHKVHIFINIRTFQQINEMEKSMQLMIKGYCLNN